MTQKEIKTLFEKSQRGQRAFSLPKDDPEFQRFQPPKKLLRQQPLPLPEIAELDLMRHFSQLAQRNMGIDTNFYPLGSCTMKLNPRVNELCAQLPGFVRTHPLAPEETVQGNLQLISELIAMLCEISGMAAGSLLPNAGAQGEFVGVQMIKAYHHHRGDSLRTELLIPDSAHGTNPATAAMAGLKVISLPTDAEGDIDLDALRQACSERTAGLMLTNPNTFGLFSPHIIEITDIVHACGGMLFYDGANLNAILNRVRPGGMGFDVMHLNLHKTFSTPHGGGGPGSGPVLCNETLKPFLPVPRVVDREKGYRLIWDDPKSIGRIASFHGNFGIYLRAYIYAKLHGHFGLRRIADQAVLNANYMKAHLSGIFTVPYPQYCMHEFVAQTSPYLAKGIRALDIAKRLLDYGFYAPTIYFPITLKECMLIEPTETESKATLDSFIEALYDIVKEIETDPTCVRTAPHTLSVSRLDEVRAAKSVVSSSQCRSLTS